MLRVPLVTTLAREMRLNFFEVDQALEMLRVAHSHGIGARNAIENFEVDKTLEMLQVPLVLLVTSHGIGTRYAIDSFFNHIFCQ